MYVDSKGLMNMLGWDLTVYRGAATVLTTYPYVEGGEEICRIEPTPNCGLAALVAEVAIETISETGYPNIYRVRAYEFPHDKLNVPRLDVPNDEIIIVEMWDQS